MQKAIIKKNVVLVELCKEVGYRIKNTWQVFGGFVVWFFFFFTCRRTRSNIRLQWNPINQEIRRDKFLNLWTSGRDSGLHWEQKCQWEKHGWENHLAEIQKCPFSLAKVLIAITMQFHFWLQTTSLYCAISC